MALTSGGAATLLAGLALLGWLTSWRRLACLHPSSIPMAPSTAVALLALGAGAMLRARRTTVPGLAAGAWIVTVLAAAQLTVFALGLPPALDALFVAHPDIVAGAPTGRMSPLTALGLALSGIGLGCLGSPGRGAASALTGIGVTLLGAVITLGYLTGAPFLYGGTIVPVAFPTALALAGLGLALVGLAPKDSAPLRPLAGDSVRAKLLRAFLPVAPIMVALGLVFDPFEELEPALNIVLLTVVSAVVVTLFVARAARSVADELERAQAERERSWRDADRLAAIVRSSTDAIYTEDLAGTITSWNPSAEQLFGYHADEIVGRSAERLIPAGHEEEWKAVLDRIRAGNQASGEETRQRKDGTLVLVSRSESPLHDAEGRVVGASVIVRDVSEQRRAQQALLENERALRVFFESDVAGILFADARGGLVANDQFLRITGHSRADLEAGRVTWAEITPPEFRDRDEAARREALARGACAPYEKQYIRKDGSRVWVMVSYAILDRERERSVGFVVDIDARKRVEEDLRRSEERFARVFQSGLMGIGIGEAATGRLVDVNARYAEFFGYERDEMIGRTVFELGLWAQLAERERLVARLADGGSATGEAAFRHKSGEIRHALVSMEAIRLSGTAEKLYMVGLVDLTEHKRLELLFLQAQKLEAVGRLAGGVAHDFNNLLGVIVGCGELLRRTATDPQRRRLDQILEAAERGARLTRQLLAFSRKQVVQPRVLDLNVLVADMEKLLGRLIGEDVDLAIVPEPDLGRVKADPGQLEQVLMNLCVNARDAMPDGGLLRLETANVDLGPDEAARHPPMTAGRYVRLSVSDTGCGIDRETLPRIFEPFFTTKEKGKGTGLGLATAYGIVKQAGGFIWVHSEVGRGTTFKVYLPRVDEPVVPLAAHQPAPAPGGSETILLVEDEENLRAVTREVLEDHGYRVLEAAGPEEALALGRGHAGAIHLLLTDVVMPGQSGRELATALAAARPDLRVLYMSGYTDDILAHHGVLAPGTLLVSKPVTTPALLRSVREALGSGDTGGDR